MVDIATVAEHAGVSTATVSRVFNGKSASQKARERVLASAEELGYVMSSSASNLASGRTRTLGYTAPFLDRWYFAEILKGIESELIAAGYDLLVYSPQGADHQRDIALPTSLRRNAIDGLIVASLDIATDAIHTLQTLNKPIVSIGRALEGATEIRIDDVGMARTATEHLISLGHTRIGHLGLGEIPGVAFQLGQRRYDGWTSALDDAHIPVDLTLHRQAEFSMQSGYHAAKQLLGMGQHRPTAIVADSDEIAFGIILAARDLGLQIPRDLSIVGIDNHSQAEFFGLTTVAQDPHAQGSLAARIILCSLDDAAMPLDTVATTRLMVRDSTRTPYFGDSDTSTPANHV